MHVGSWNHRFDYGEHVQSRRWEEVDKLAFGPYRAWLLRANHDLPKRRLAVIQINPSIAGAEQTDGTPDATTHRVERWADYESPCPFGEVMYLNVWMWRATQIGDLARILAANDGYELARGPNADAVIKENALESAVVVAGWGDMKDLRKACNPLVDRRISEVLANLEMDLYCIGETENSGQPRHSRRWNFSDRTARLWRSKLSHGLDS